MLLAACAKESGPAKPAAKRDAATASPVQPAPPAGTILPRVGKVRNVSPGDATTAYTWKAVYEVDPAEARVRRVLDQARVDGVSLDAGDAGAAVYREEVRATGVDVHDLGPGFSYPIQGGKLDVIVRPDDDFHRGDPNGFTISVGPAGG